MVLVYRMRSVPRRQGTSRTGNVPGKPGSKKTSAKTTTAKKVSTPKKKVNRVLPNLGGSYVILDLDHTLINSEVSPIANSRLENTCDFYFKITGIYYYVYKRPGVDKYLDTLFRCFKGVAVWTAAVASYAKQVIKGLFGPRAAQLTFIWTRKNCELDLRGRYKPLSKVWADPTLGKLMGPNNTVHVDNTADVMRYNLPQALLVPHYFYYRMRNGHKILNTEDDYLFYLTNLTLGACDRNNMPRIKGPRSQGLSLREYIRRGNLLTQWWDNLHPQNL